MGENRQIQDAVTRIVGQVFERHAGELRQQIAQQVVAELAPVLEGKAPLPAPPRVPAEDVLHAAIGSIQDAPASQAEILNGLLNGCANFCRRAALFVLRAGSASLWQSRGFHDGAALKNFTVDPASGLAGRAAHEHVAVAAAAADFDPTFVERVGHPCDGNVLLVPLVVREKVAAFVYADGGTEGPAFLNASALQVLVRVTGLWVELLSLRKAGHAPATLDPAPAPEPPPAREPAAMAAAATAAPSSLPTAEAATPAVEPPARQAAPPAAPAAGIAPADAELHRKAKRFAKLLVDEIRLYNQAKVAAGREHRDLYDRLREDIDKSRATYDKRYASTPAAAFAYFDQELVRILADNDPALLGGGYAAQAPRLN